MEPLEKLQAKYRIEPANDQPAVDKAVGKYPLRPKQPPGSWRDSRPVCELADYLKQYEGFRLVEHDGCPALRFISGVRPEDNKRWSQAETAVELLWNARDDLFYLMRNKLLKLPAAGPS